MRRIGAIIIALGMLAIPALAEQTVSITPVPLGDTVTGFNQEDVQISRGVDGGCRISIQHIATRADGQHAVTAQGKTYSTIAELTGNNAIIKCNKLDEIVHGATGKSFVEWMFTFAKADGKLPADAVLSGDWGIPTLTATPEPTETPTE